MKRGFIWRTLRAPAYRHGSISVTPVARAVGMRWPMGGWLWLFPLAVEVRQHDGKAAKQDKPPQRLPIFDVTRLVLILFLAGTLLALIGWRWQSRRRRENDAVWDR